MMRKKKVYEVCGECTDAFSAMEALKRAVPEILITNVLMPGISGIELAMQVRRLYPDIRTVPMSEKPGYAVEGYEMRASCVILKPLTGSMVIKP